MAEPGTSAGPVDPKPHRQEHPIASEPVAAPPPVGHIFLSCASQDSTAAQRVCTSLETSGQRCWLAPRDVHAGEYYATAIIEAINSCRMLVLLLSRSAIESPHVLREVERACSKRHPILTVRLDDSTIPSQLEYFLSANQWLDGSAGRIEAVLPALVAASRAQSAPDRGAVAPGATPPVPPVGRTAGAARIVIAAAVVVALAGVSVLALRLRHDRAATPASHAESAPMAVAATAAPRTAVAVLPFANLTGDASKEYLGDGMAEELINTLAKVKGLKVPARTSTFAYKGRNTDIRQIAKDLGVGTILEGSVRAAGKRIRITAQLINAADGLHLWSETYDEEFTDIFKLQDKLATQIATALQPNLGDAAQAAVAQGPPTRDVEAYNLYLRGWELVSRPLESNLQQAIGLFQQAIERDPGFARAYVGLAQAQYSWLRLTWRYDHATAAIRFARKALELDPRAAGAHDVLAIVAGYRMQLFEMEAQSRISLAAGADDGLVHTSRAVSLLNTGHVREMLAEAQKGYALAPANPQVVANLAVFQALAGHSQDAMRFAEEAVSKGFPKGTPPLHLAYGYAALQTGRYADMGVYLSGLAMGSDYESSPAAPIARLAFAAMADPSRSEAAFAARDRLYPRNVAFPPEHAAEQVMLCLDASTRYATLGTHRALDVAYDLMSQCVDQLTDRQMLRLPFFWLPAGRAFRQDPRFQALATRLGLMDYWQQYGPPDDCNLTDGKLACH